MAFISNSMPPGGIIKIPRQAGYAKPYGGEITDEQIYDEYSYDYSIGTYRKIESIHEIQERQQSEIASKKEKVKSLIAYYYNR